ncbi:putative inorganic phosphate cotransporter [Penaeus chinensis]|uniref:putative inorganic phosphate cotransporter n=1 Tax=Penaeus chinensis TaxID=139456 RepID=UPI001FB7D790|nr:putative inorganic phosphate cotransporter [Penaeus chinensis]
MASSLNLAEHMEGVEKEGIFVVEDGRRNSTETANGNETSKKCWPVRYTLGLLLFFGLAVEYSLRVNLSIAIVAMAGTTELPDNSNSTADICPVEGNSTDSEDKYTEGEFDWDENTQGLILGAFFYGYTCTNLLDGRAAEYLGGRLVFGLGAVVSSCIALLSPLCARTSTGFFVASRVAMGIAQGVSLPAINSIMATWFPPEEKAKINPFIYGGMQIGTVISLSVSGWLISVGFLGGWPSVFYVFGALGIVWGIPWFLLTHDRPEKHPRISQAELSFIQGHQETVKKAEIVSISWKEIVTSGPMWACVFMMTGGSFGFYTLLTELPTYLANIQHFDMNSSGVLSAIPYVMLWVFGILWGFFMDRLFSAGVLSIRTIRRLSTAVAHYVPAVALIAMCFVNCNSTIAMAMLCMALGFNGASYSGNSLSEQDIAPNLAGTLLGITNTFGSATGFLAPLTVGAITSGNQGSLAAWRLVFIITAIIYVVTCTLYLLLMSAEVQPWNEPKRDQKRRVGPSASYGSNQTRW